MGFYGHMMRYARRRGVVEAKEMLGCEIKI